MERESKFRYVYLLIIIFITVKKTTIELNMFTYIDMCLTDIILVSIICSLLIVYLGT